MPIYEFKCETCEKIEEVFMKMSDPAPEHCSHCNGPMRKIISQTSFALKGDGWYVTDYKKSPSTNKTASTSDNPPAVNEASATQHPPEQAAVAAVPSSSSSQPAAKTATATP